MNWSMHDDVIKHTPRYWPFVRGIHRSTVNSPHKGQWRGALMFSLICAWLNGWVNNREAGDLRRHRAHCDVIVMESIMSDDITESIKTTQRRLYCAGAALYLPWHADKFCSCPMPSERPTLSINLGKSRGQTRLGQWVSNPCNISANMKQRCEKLDGFANQKFLYMLKMLLFISQCISSKRHVMK